MPELEEALQRDLDPDFGRLRSYRSYEDQLAKLMGNIERLRRELTTNPGEVASFSAYPGTPFCVVLCVMYSVAVLGCAVLVRLFLDFD